MGINALLALDLFSPFLVAWLGGREGWATRPWTLVYTSWDCHEIPGLERIKQLWAKILRNIILMDYLERISSFGHLSRLLAIVSATGIWLYLACEGSTSNLNLW
jgi:hypothetical protein